MAKETSKAKTSALIARLAAAPADASLPTRLRALGVATACLQMANLLKAHSARFVRTGASFAQDMAEILEEGAQEIFAVFDKAQADSPLDERKISLELADQATSLRSKQRKLLDYFFENDPVIGPRLKVLLSGRGYVDLANDLIAYADIYVAQEAVLKADSRYYLASDVALARELAAQIRAELGEAPTNDANAARLNRLTYVLGDVYEDAYLAAQLELRNEPEVLALFQPFVTASRGPAKRRAKEAPKPE